MNFLKFSALPIQKDWSFSGKTIKDTAYITHGYYTYPAKFIPQLASRLIKEHTQEGDIVVDPFMGSGTTIVEAIVNNRIGIGTDINEIAALIAKVKTTPIAMDLLSKAFSELLLEINLAHTNDFLGIQKTLPQRVDYWFKPNIKNKLSLIMHHILKIENLDIKDFFLVSFAQILKSCSIWLQKSVKPTRDLNKQEVDPFYKFEWQSSRMIKKHNEFHKVLPAEVISKIQSQRIIQNGSSQNISCKDGTATLIVTSPPYVTSYEYADLHQLPSLWFGFCEELSAFRKKFIGSSYRERDKINLKSEIANEIIAKLENAKKSMEVESYFADMLESFLEMKRVLRKGGRAAIVIGNTKIKGVDILNAEVFQEQLKNIGFRTYEIIHREIPSKMLPSTRDTQNGRFTKVTDSNRIMAYPTEYILIMEKR